MYIIECKPFKMYTNYFHFLEVENLLKVTQLVIEGADAWLKTQI